VHSAEVIGTAGIERVYDSWLRDPANEGRPLRLSLDLTVQAAVERVLEGGMMLLNAKGATAVIMDVHTGELVSLASLPDFDPNDRPLPPTEGDPSDSPIFNRAVQGVYELGSTYKIFAVAQALELGLVNPTTMIDTTSPMRWGRHRISDFRNYGPALSVTDVIVKSSNVGTARIALQIGAERQRDFLTRLGLLDVLPVELSEAARARPLRPPASWPDITTMTVSYGHGTSASPLHLAAAYASLVNGGTVVRPTLLRNPNPLPGPRVVSEQTSAQLRSMLRDTVARGTASFADVEGYDVGGKTGTADKPDATGGYHDDRVLATFASIFPSDDPKYVVVVTMDEPVDTTGTEPRRTAGWTAVPVAAEIIRRVAPLLGMRPEVEIEPDAAAGVTLARN
jgi:cell division protein FtsI (penicillin-binding protein 3)